MPSGDSTRPTLPAHGGDLPSGYEREPTYGPMLRERDVYVPMRDGVRLCVDVYRPDTSERLPALLAGDRVSLGR